MQVPDDHFKSQLAMFLPLSDVQTWGKGKVIVLQGQFYACAARLLIELCSETVDFHLFFINGAKHWPVYDPLLPQGVGAGRGDAKQLLSPKQPPMRQETIDKDSPSRVKHREDWLCFLTCSGCTPSTVATDQSQCCAPSPTAVSLCIIEGINKTNSVTG